MLYIQYIWHAPWQKGVSRRSGFPWQNGVSLPLFFQLAFHVRIILCITADVPLVFTYWPQILRTLRKWTPFWLPGTEMETRTNMEIYHTRVYWAKIIVNTIKITYISKYSPFCTIRRNFVLRGSEFRTSWVLNEWMIWCLMSLFKKCTEIRTNLEIHHTQVCWAKQNGDKIKNYV